MTSPRCKDCGAPAVVELLLSPGEPFHPPYFVCERGQAAVTLPYRRLTVADVSLSAVETSPGSTVETATPA